MDKTAEPTLPARRWDWLPQQMPGVAKLMADKRKAIGSAWVNECWRHGVVEGQPGWFFACEGALMVGTLWPDAEVLALAHAELHRKAPMVILRPQPEAADAPA
jgi:hypothetical protein